MIAARFRSVGWVAGVASAALCCYLVSQSVAAERATLAGVDRRISDTRADIARLQTEIGTRGRMSQLDRWNGEFFALQAPAARQFLASETQLASFGRPQPALPVDPDIAAARGAVQEAAYRAPPAPVAPAPVVTPVAAEAGAAPPAPLLRAATYVRERSDRVAALAAPMVKVAYAPAATADAAPITPTPKPTTKPAARSKPQSLLPDDLDSLIDAEVAGRAGGRPRK